MHGSPHESTMAHQNEALIAKFAIATENTIAAHKGRRNSNSGAGEAGVPRSRSSHAHHSPRGGRIGLVQGERSGDDARFSRGDPIRNVRVPEGAFC